MGFQLVIGTCVIAAALLLQAAFIVLAHWGLTQLGPRMNRYPSGPMQALIIAGGGLWMMASHTGAVWAWAVLFEALGIFDGLEPALYFALVAFTTLGFGDIILGADWRLLGGLCAANGLFAFGFSTAFLVDFFNKLRDA